MIIYKSSDASAPALTNANGSLINVLDKILVAGYGSKAAAGWTKPYTGTNLAVFRQGSGGNGRYLRVSDGQIVNSTYRSALCRGYEAMTAVSTGTNPFPTTSQIAGNGGMFFYNTVGGYTPSEWVCYANSKTFHLFAWAVNSRATPSGPEYMGFGNFNSRKSGDTWNEFLWVGNATIGVGMTMQPSGPEIWVPRNDLAAVGSKGGTPLSPRPQWTEAYVGQGNATQHPYPDRIVSGILLDQPQLWVDGYWRGTIPGIWSTPHGAQAIGGDGTTFSGNGALSGKSFEVIGPIAPNFYGTAYPIIEVSNTW